MVAENRERAAQERDKRRGERRDDPPLLEMRGISKTFGPVRALEDVHFTAWRGEIHALMGENGAGKSTLMKILGGILRPDPGGEIRLDGTPLVLDGPKTARAAGIVVIHQELALAPNLTVAENIFLGEEKQRFGRIDRAAMNEAARPLLERLGAPFAPTSRVGRLSLASRQLVEIARALAARARVLVMDEPTTALSERETEKLFALIEGLRDEGLAIIYISHRMAEIDRLADRVSVLRDGRHVGSLPRAEADHARIVGLMVGRDVASFYKKDHAATPPRTERLLEVRGVADGKRVRGCSFGVHAGEVVGIAGLVGAGRSELARAVCGISRRTSGEIWLSGRRLDPSSPAAAIAAGLVYLTEDRKADGVHLDMSVHENIVLATLDRYARFGVRSLAAERARAKAAIAQLSIRTPHERLKVRALSGGNQQKVLLARLLETKPKVLFLDEPTRGIDIGAKSEIYRLIDTLAAEGLGVVVISSELPELIGIADRILVMRDGLIAGELHASPGRPITQEAIMAIITGTMPAAA
jgi:ribose transport system ATP-binding protein